MKTNGNSKKLNLKKESIRELSSTQLAHVAGGGSQILIVGRDGTIGCQ